jgi:hypothetical protein
VSGSAVALPLALARDSVLRFLGYPEGASPPSRIAALLDRILVEARALAEGRGVFTRLPVDRAGDVGLEKIDAAELVIGIVTIGASVERRAATLIENGSPTDALLLDAAGSAAVEEAADRLGGMITGDNGSGVRHVSCRISPGYGAWSIRSQPSLFDRLPHEDIGVELLGSMLMVPRKSISFAMWVGADARPIAGLSGCSRCQLERCRYRREDS